MKKGWVSKLDTLVENLRVDTIASTYELGFLEGTIANKVVGEKIYGSFSGHAADVAIRAVVSKTALYICRTLEGNGDSISVFLDSARERSEFIFEKRKLSRPDLPDGFIEKSEIEKSLIDLEAALIAVTSQYPYKWLRVHRDERLGHSMRLRSGSRRKLLGEELPEDEVTYDQLLELGNETARLAMEAVRIWTFGLTSPRDRTRIVRDQTQKFWELLPVLKDVE